MIVSEILSRRDDITGLRIELQYLPCLAYFTCLLKYDRISIDVEERYVKQSYRNRCRVLTANKIDVLTVPVKKYEAATPTKDIKIDYSQDWLRRHLGCFKSAYGKSPFYEYYAPELLDIYDKKLAYLVELNYELLTFCLRLVGIKKDIQYNLSGGAGEADGLIDAISLINNKKGDISSDYYKPMPYYQTFGNDFVSNLSIIDLIFNIGPEAKSVLLSSCKS